MIDASMFDLSIADQDGNGSVSPQEWADYVDALYETCGHRLWCKIGEDLVSQIIERHEKEEKKKTREHDALAWLENEGDDWLNPKSGGLVVFNDLQKQILQ